MAAKKISLIFLLAVLGISVFAQIKPSGKADLLNLEVDVVYLSSDLLEGRETGTAGEERAAKYIARRFADLGLQPAGTDGSWYQGFEFEFKPNPHQAEGEKRVGKNVAAFIDNKAPTTVVIGAHYDHLGHGIFGSRHTGEPAIHNGADDNASGVAVMLYLAAVLQQSDVDANNYLFVAFSGEELGLYGSKSFVQQSGLDPEQVNYMLNFDMVGRLNAEKVVVVNGSGTSPMWAKALEQIDRRSLIFQTNESGVGPSDHTSFYLEDIPVLHFFTGQHADYHKPEDDAELVNFTGMLDIGAVCANLVAYLNDQGELTFTKTKDESQGREAARFKVSLGVMPDYVYQGEGLRIDGVLEDRPAQKAGLEKGDVIIAIGDTEVKDIYDYMEGLGQFKAGDKTVIKVKRGEEILKKKVAF